MSLEKAILEIADDVEQEFNGLDGDGEYEYPHACRKAVMGFVKQLRRVVQAVEGNAPAVPVQNPFMTPEIQHRLEIDRAKAQMRTERGLDKGNGIILPTGRAEELEEQVGSQMVEIVNGPDAGTLLDVPVAAFRETGVVKFAIEDRVYTLCGNKLKFSEEETRKLQARKDIKLG